jgi:hypothetical protein
MAELCRSGLITLGRRDGLFGGNETAHGANGEIKWFGWKYQFSAKELLSLPARDADTDGFLGGQVRG